MPSRRRPTLELVLAAAAALFAAAPTLSAPLTGSAPPKKQDPSSLHPDYRAGLLALYQGKLDEAQRAFERAAKAQPRAAAPLLGQAEIAFKRQRPQDALAWISKALEVAPNDSHAHASMGRYLIVSGKPKEAEVSLRKAIQIDARFFRAHIDLADLLAGQQRWSAAVPLYEKCVTLDPTHAGAHYGLGLARAQLGDNAGAHSALTKAAQLSPDNGLPHLALARWHGGRKEYPQALTAVGEALKRNPNWLDAQILRGDLLDAGGDSGAAIAAYEQAAKAHPTQATPPLHMAMLHHRRGQDAQALPLYMRALDLDPRSALALNNVADIHSKRSGGLDEAERWAVKAVDAAPKSADAHDTLGWIRRAKGDLAAARSSLEKATQLDPGNGEMLYRLAQVYADQGDGAKAKQTLQAAMKASKPVLSAEPARKLMADLGR